MGAKDIRQLSTERGRCCHGVRMGGLCGGVGKGGQGRVGGRDGVWRTPSSQVPRVGAVMLRGFLGVPRVPPTP